MANFDEAYNLTMHAEGGYVNDPQDSGGETYKGVSRKNNPNWSGWKTIDAIKQTHPASLNAAFGADADLQTAIHKFYQANYWDVNSTGAIADQQLANQVFDTAVNCGTGTAAKFLQEAAKVVVDRQIGPHTIAAVNTADPQAIYNDFIGFRKDYYLAIIAKNPTQKKFQASWFSRLWDYKPVVA
jgi:lysozyme family protein